MFEAITKTAIVVPGFLFEMTVAFICGGLIGLAGGTRHRVSGLRNNILVCIGIVMYLNIPELISLNSDLSIICDPNQMASFLVIGMAILCAGILIGNSTDKSAGMQDVSSIWLVGAIGIIIGLDLWLLALLVTGLVLLIMTMLQWLERGFTSQPDQLLLKLTVRNDDSALREKISNILETSGVQLLGFHAEQGAAGVKLTIHGSKELEDVRPLLGKLWTVEGVTDVEH